MAENFEISLGSAGTISVEIERSRRSKRLTLRVLPGGKILVSVPEKMRGDVSKKAETFARENALWLKHALEREKRRKRPPAKTLVEYLRERPEISAFGKTFAIEIGRASVEPFFVFRENSPVAVICLRDGNESSDAEEILRRIAARVLSPRLRELSERCSVSAGKVTVRAQRSRWGSCSASGDISLNWRLILLPPELQDHVIFHELAHIRHMDHSGEFWDLLNSWDERTGAHNRELSELWSPRIFSISDV